jgi:hypothetical protein
MTIGTDIRAEVCSGNIRYERKLAVCTGNIPLSVEDRAELLAVLAGDADETISERAQGVLTTIPAEEFIAALGRVDSDPRLFNYCAQNLLEKAGVADAMANNPACPMPVVGRLAGYLTTAGIQALLDDLDRLASSPELIEALANSPAATAQQTASLREMQGGAAPAHEVETAVADAEPDPKKRETLLQRMAKMNVVERIRLAFRGNREERMALIRDPNRIVQRSVMQSPRLSDQDVEAFSAMTTVSSEVFRAIALSRLFMKNYVVVRNLIKNPKCPLDISLHLLPRLTALDLKQLCSNKNIPETLRSMAVKTQRQRAVAASGKKLD